MRMRMLRSTPRTGKFGSGDKATKGRAALHKMVADLKQSRIDREAKGESKRPGTLHMDTSHIHHASRMPTMRLTTPTG